MLVEVKLDLLVCDVDAQLFKGVALEVFKSKDVQDSHVHAALCGTSKERKRGQTHLFFYVMEQANPQQPYRLIKV